ncbi:hypothetical protein Mgra_00007923 [Meloidogyne graminicola]|uniref:Uncharacterized protein n=1 Tax=Meloidogyne graminicola TaxID=189291 RepID=A0A8S9ZHE0_9BILA|nr:hypothetical protein Mgra_00007923 [Meloidogyne graminicola]
MANYIKLQFILITILLIALMFFKNCYCLKCYYLAPKTSTIFLQKCPVNCSCFAISDVNAKTLQAGCIDNPTNLRKQADAAGNGLYICNEYDYCAAVNVNK